jgi:hypothetical protein
LFFLGNTSSSSGTSTGTIYPSTSIPSIQYSKGVPFYRYRYYRASYRYIPGTSIPVQLVQPYQYFSISTLLTVPFCTGTLKYTRTKLKTILYFSHVFVPVQLLLLQTSTMGNVPVFILWCWLENYPYRCRNTLLRSTTGGTTLLIPVTIRAIIECTVYWYELVRFS